MVVSFILISLGIKIVTNPPVSTLFWGLKEKVYVAEEYANVFEGVAVASVKEPTVDKNKFDADTVSTL